MTRTVLAGVVTGLMLAAASCGEYAPAEALVTAPIVKQGQCATGYTRTLPNYCAADGAESQIATDNTSCTALNLTSTAGVPASAKAVSIRIGWRVLSGNAVGTRSNIINFYNSTPCLVQTDFSQVSVREQIATAAGTSLAFVYETLHFVPVLLDGGNATVWYLTGNAGGNGNGDFNQYLIMGYYD